MNVTLSEGALGREERLIIPDVAEAQIMRFLYLHLHGGRVDVSVCDVVPVVKVGHNTLELCDQSMGFVVQAFQRKIIRGVLEKELKRRDVC